MKYNYNLKSLPESNISKFNHYLKNIPNCLMLTYGESDLPVDSFIKDALIDSLLNGHDNYCESQGKKSTRKSISEYENKVHKTSYTEDNCLLCNGSTEALFLVLSSLICPKDEVLIIEPDYPLYETLTTYLGGRAIKIPSLNDFEINYKEISKHLNNRTKAIILNYPNNPTGKVLTQKECQKLHQILKHNNCAIILDNVYQYITFQTNHYLTQFQDLYERIIIINSQSKSHQLTGWRLGYILADKELISLCTKLHQNINVCMSEFMADALQSSLSIPVNSQYYYENMKYVVNELNKLKIDYYKPQGGFYILINIQKFQLSSEEFCKYLANNYQLGLIPGSFFHLEGYCRLSFACDKKKLKQAMKILKKAIRGLV